MTRRAPHLITVAFLITACSVSISAQPATDAELRAKAEQGDAEAQYNLGMLYADGRGVPQDRVEAARMIQGGGRLFF